MKVILTLLLLAVCLTLTLSAGASHSGGNGPANDKADGTVEDIFPSTLHINAISEPGGANARGHFYYRVDNPGAGYVLDDVGDVTCLRVFDGNKAWIGGRVDRSKVTGLPAGVVGYLFLVVDRGEPGDMDSHLDFPQTTVPTTCPSSGDHTFAHKSGNFIVHQATP
jgi:hypothetical protein